METAEKMTQERANKFFDTELGQQLDVLYSTSDGRVFIRKEEAYMHSKGSLDEGTEPLADKTIAEWFPKY